MIGKELKTEREEMGLSQAELAERLGVSEHQVIWWEQEETPILEDHWRIFELAVDHVGIDIDYEKRQPETEAVLAAARAVLSK